MNIVNHKMSGALVAIALLGFTTAAQADSRGDLLERLTAELDPAGMPVAVVEAPSDPTLRVAPIMADPAPPETDRVQPVRARKARTLESLRAQQEQKQSESRSPMTAWFMVGLVLLGLGAVAWWLKRRATTNNPWAAAAHRMETIATHRVNGKHSVCLVRVPGRVLVLGMSDKGVTLLTELDESDLEGMPEEIETGDDERSTFSDRLTGLRERIKARRDPFRALAEADDAPVDGLLRLDERAAIRERLEALRHRSVA